MAAQRTPEHGYPKVPTNNLEERVLRRFLQTLVDALEKERKRTRELEDSVKALTVRLEKLEKAAK
jgi:hypothetical protein